MSKSSFIALVISFAAAMPARACKCAKFSDPNELFRKSDLVFFGTWADVSKTDVNFFVHRLAKGEESMIGSSKIAVRWSGDVHEMCRGYRTAGDYLVFAMKGKNGPYEFLTDCYSDVVSAQVTGYEYRGRQFTDFDFFKVNVLSASNGVRPLYAADLSGKDAREFAKQHLLQDADFKKFYLLERDKWSAISAELKIDERKQPYWRVQIARNPSRAKGEFYLVDFYNSLSESYRILPGK